jgi:hypothetical protein
VKSNSDTGACKTRAAHRATPAAANQHSFPKTPSRQPDR